MQDNKGRGKRVGERRIGEYFVIHTFARRDLELPPHGCMPPSTGPDYNIYIVQILKESNTRYLVCFIIISDKIHLILWGHNDLDL